MSRKRANNPTAVIESKRDLAREAAIENTLIRTDGVGEDPALRKALIDLPNQNNLDALNTALLLQQIVRGQASILDNQALMNDELNKLRARQAKYDEEARKWEEDRQKFIDKSFDDAERTVRNSRLTPEQAQAIAMSEAQKAREQARAEAAVARLQFEERVKNSPKEFIVSPGILETYRNGSELVSHVIPEILTIKNKRWVLQPGVLTEVPDFVARQYRNRLQSREELRERQQAISVNRNNGAMSEFGQVQQDWQKIDRKYGVQAQPQPISAGG